nr:hypothetical protein [Tanacetum cinerariifolium]
MLQPIRVPCTDVFLNHLNLVLNPRTKPCTAATVPMMTCHPPIRSAATCTLRQHGQRRRSTTVNAAGNRSTAADHGGDRRSTVAVNDGRRWRTTVDCRWTTVDHHRTTGQRWLVGWSTSGLDRACHVACHVSATCAHVDADVDIKQQVGIEHSTLWLET